MPTLEIAAQTPITGLPYAVPRKPSCSDSVALWSCSEALGSFGDSHSVPVGFCFGDSDSVPVGFCFGDSDSVSVGFCFGDSDSVPVGFCFGVSDSVLVGFCLDLSAASVMVDMVVMVFCSSQSGSLNSTVRELV